MKILANHYHKTQREFGGLTPYQIMELMRELIRDINWIINLAVLPAGGKLDMKYHPLEPDRENKKESVINPNNKRSLDNFIDSINSV